MIADWKNKELKYEQDRKKLVELNPVADSLFSIIDLTYKKIIGEYPTSITPQLRAIAVAAKKDAITEMIKLQEETLSKIIKKCKREITRDLKKIKET